MERAMVRNSVKSAEVIAAYNAKEFATLQDRCH